MPDPFRVEGLGAASFRTAAIPGATPAPTAWDYGRLPYRPGVLTLQRQRSGSRGSNADIKADRGSAAALRMGDVTLQNPPMPGPEQR